MDSTLYGYPYGCLYRVSHCVWESDTLRENLNTSRSVLLVVHTSVPGMPIPVYWYQAMMASHSIECTGVCSWHMTPSRRWSPNVSIYTLPCVSIYTCPTPDLDIVTSHTMVLCYGGHSLSSAHPLDWTAHSEERRCDRCSGMSVPSGMCTIPILIHGSPKGITGCSITVSPRCGVWDAI